MVSASPGRRRLALRVLLLALLALTAANLRALGHGPGGALLLFLPGTLYFSFNRFDAWPAAFVALAFLMQWKDRRLGAAAALGLGAMMKWYPILLVPLFLAHNLGTERARGHGFVAALPRAVRPRVRLSQRRPALPGSTPRCR